MELNETAIKAIEISGIIEKFFREKARNFGIYDILEQKEHQSFRIGFEAYKFFWVDFCYEDGLCEFFVLLGEHFRISLSKNSQSIDLIDDWNIYLKDIMNEIELRIPDKFLRAGGWIE